MNFSSVSVIRWATALIGAARETLRGESVSSTTAARLGTYQAK